MLVLQKFLKDGGTISQLRQDPYNLCIREYPDLGLAIFNYDQINTPKNCKIGIDSRGTILELGTWNKVHIPYQRFFNHNDPMNNAFVGIDDVDKFLNDYLTIIEKLDGSLFGVFYYKNKWYITTRGVIGAECNISFTLDNTKTFKILFDQIISNKPNFYDNLDPNLDYTFEIISPENRIVTPYFKEDEDLYLTGVRSVDNDFKELPINDIISIAEIINVRIPKIFKINKKENILNHLIKLQELDEGFICVNYSTHYDGFNYRRIKVKNPTYLTRLKAHKTSIYDLLAIVLFEREKEYIELFPDTEDLLMSMKAQINELIIDTENEYKKFEHINDKKTFAISIGKHKYSGSLFNMFEGISARESIVKDIGKHTEKHIAKRLLKNKFIKF